MKVSESIGGGSLLTIESHSIPSDFCSHPGVYVGSAGEFTAFQALGRLIDRGAPHTNHSNTTSIKMPSIWGACHLQTKLKPQQYPGVQRSACIQFLFLASLGSRAESHGPPLGEPFVWMIHWTRSNSDCVRPPLSWVSIGSS